MFLFSEGYQVVTLKKLEVKYHDVCNLFSNGLAKKITYLYKNVLYISKEEKINVAKY